MDLTPKYKQSSIEIKDLNDEKGIVEAYANVYDFEDSDGDISAKGSFVKTVNENYKRIRVLKDHNPRMPLGVPLAIDAKDSYGLFTVSKFNLKKELSRDMFTDIKLMVENGLNAELSIGYNVVSRSKSDKKVINEYKLHEYSFLSSWGANELSLVQGIKGIKSHYGILELIEKSYDLDYSDNRLRQIEGILKSLTNSEPLKDSTQEKEAEYKQISDFISNYKF
jgi:HK97 family phage prohead protease